ncbi:amidohydrolase family protein [Bacillus kwashiorkori]|uniref:amidohydrolase family protein n=1 Tax=Bacillus kwashiorkori TaxID=1522318 RepID=UPI0007824C8A|nr:amidohydrolase family protein [Bacillus kwashiorkori]
MSFHRKDTKIYRGQIAYTPELGKLTTIKNGYIVVESSKVKGVYPTLPKEYEYTPVEDYGNKLIIPGFVDLHSHASQVANRGIGLDRELLDWLLVYTFKEEAKFSDLCYAEKAYSEYIKLLIKNGTTRAALLGTIYRESTELLMDIANGYGLGAVVGKVNMDREAPEYYIENTDQSIIETERFIHNTIWKYPLVKPIITPRFVPATTPKLMWALAQLADYYRLPVQSHLSEDKEELEYVKRLHPEFKNYVSIYNYFGLFGQQPTIMAHCVYLSDEEIALMARKGVYVAHCPVANFNLSGSVAPIRKFLLAGINVGLGTDVGAGHAVSIKDVIWQAIQASKVYELQTNHQYKALTTAEAFYLATKGGGSFFGKVGSLEAGYDFDALVIDDSNILTIHPRTISERLERFIYLGDDRNIIQRFIAGRKVNPLTLSV